MILSHRSYPDLMFLQFSSHSCSCSLKLVPVELQSFSVDFFFNTPLRVKSLFFFLSRHSQNQDRKHRTYVYVLIVKEVLEDWEDSVNIGKCGIVLSFHMFMQIPNHMRALY